MREWKLSDLEGEMWFRLGRTVADGVFFACPCCENRHGILISWTPPSVVENGFVWTKTGGDSIDNLSISPSVNCDIPWKNTRTGELHPSKCLFHGFIRNGKVVLA